MRQFLTGIPVFILLSTMLSCKTAQKVDKPKIDILSTSIRDIKVIPTIIEVDELSNIYIVDDANVLRVYDKSKVKKFEYSDNRSGKITSLDVSNPLNPTVFYKDFGKIVMLDNSLSLVKEVNLNSGGKFVTAGPVCLSNDKNYWVYDRQTQKIVKINDIKKVLVETNHFNDLKMEGKIPHKMIEEGNFLAVLIWGDGFMLFDNFGQFIKAIPAPQALDFQFDGKTLVFKTMTGLKSQGISSFDFVSLGMPMSIKVEDVRILKMGQQVFVAGYKDGVDIVLK